MRSSPFLLLPAEIKLRIYGFCTPFYAHPQEFEGLRRASRQIRNEYEDEALKIMLQYLDGIKEQWPYAAKMHLVPPRNFGDLRNITIQLPISLYFPKRSREWSKPDSLRNTKMELCLAPLYSLHISNLAFEFYDDTGTFINWSPWVIPTGLLYDMIDPIGGLHNLPFHSGAPSDADATTRSFQLCDNIHIRRLEYNWRDSKVVAHSINLNSLVQVDAETANFFLHNSGWFQHPIGLVHNWGRGADSIWFDLKASS